MRTHIRPPEGFLYEPSLFSPEVVAALARRVASLSFKAETHRGRDTIRKYAQFGQRYVTAKRKTLSDAPPIPDDLRSILDSCRSAFCISQDFDQLIATLYPPGAGIDWHCDKPIFDAVIVGVSFGFSGQIQLAPKGTKRASCELTLPPGSVYVLSGPARWDYDHRIRPVEEARYSLTFRRVRT